MPTPKVPYRTKDGRSVLVHRAVADHLRDARKPLLPQQPAKRA